MNKARVAEAVRGLFQRKNSDTLTRVLDEMVVTILSTGVGASTTLFHKRSKTERLSSRGM